MSKEAMKLALEALIQAERDGYWSRDTSIAGEALREALAEQPAQRSWVGLTDEEVEEVWKRVEASDFRDCVQPFAKAIEAALRSKNT